MPNTKAATKALRQSLVRRERNLARKKELKTVLKDYAKIIASGQKDEAKTKLMLVYKKLDKAAKVNLIKANKADRLKSKLARKIK